MDALPPPRSALYLCDYCGAYVLFKAGYSGLRNCARRYSFRLEFVTNVEDDKATDFR